MSGLFGATATELLSSGFEFIVAWMPVWIPLGLVLIFWRLWVDYVQAVHIAGKEWLMLGVQLPKEQPRSPLGMEVLLASLHNKGLIGDFLRRYWKGNVTPWVSLEIVSFAGDIHFFIRAEKNQRNVLMSRIYAQFPDAEVFEADDYTRRIEYDEDAYSMWANEFVLTKADAYPIKTYVDYGLDKDPKEEVKIDPILPMIEWMGSLGPGEQAWVQVVIRYHLDTKRKSGEKWFEFKGGKLKWKGGWFAKESAWRDAAKKEIEKIKKEALGKEDERGGAVQNLTPGQKEAIAALERSISKLAFDVGIRGVYLAEQDRFDPANIGGLIASFTQYNTNNLNGFRPSKTPGYTYPWQDPWGRREARNKRNLFEAYRRRGFFYAPFRSKTAVLNTEELATIYHFPGRTVTTPTFKRIESRKSGPPTNLPV